MSPLRRFMGGHNNAKDVAKECAMVSAALANTPPPNPDASVEVLMEGTLQALRALREQYVNERRGEILESIRMDDHRAEAARVRRRLAEDLVVIDEQVRKVRDTMDGDIDLARGLVRWLEVRLGPLLEAAGVSSFTDTGPFDAHKHQSVSALPASSPSEVDTIAETVRPGLLIGNEILRTQLVVVYAEDEEPSA